jgi:hypothetical protein
MKTATLFLATMLALATAAAAQTAEKEKILSRHEAGSLLEVRDVKTAADGTVSGTVINNSNTIMRDVKLLVRYAWIWKNERHPGDDSPGRSQYLPLSGDIAAGASVPFSYTPSPPLPARTDGTFQTSVSVQGFTQVGE